jgi:hypothetical protein
VVQGSESFEFLDEVIPQRISAEDAAAMNVHLKLAQGVVVNPDKKASCIGVSRGTSCCFSALFFIAHEADTIAQARVDTC